ncbi:hypothetical protein BaRGS_00038587 [Batillaria attramentaria]|uniref:Uncharacterized protein n=1 Tax=Batillaria attramentaria TaxID=370345 RepID=A0ABD0J6E6_9CAEN
MVAVLTFSIDPQSISRMWATAKAGITQVTELSEGTILKLYTSPETQLFHDCDARLVLQGGKKCQRAFPSVQSETQLFYNYDVRLVLHGEKSQRVFPPVKTVKRNYFTTMTSDSCSPHKKSQRAFSPVKTVKRNLLTTKNVPLVSETTEMSRCTAVKEQCVHLTSGVLFPLHVL